MQIKSILALWQREEKKLQAARAVRKKQAKRLCCDLLNAILAEMHYVTFTIGLCSVQNIQFSPKEKPEMLVSPINAQQQGFVKALQAAHSLLFAGLTDERNDPQHILRISIGQGRTMVSLSPLERFEEEKKAHMLVMAKPSKPFKLRPTHL